MMQELYNAAIGIAGALGGFVLYALWNAVKDLQEDDKRLTTSISGLEKIVVGDYIKRTEMERIVRDMHSSFEKQLDMQTRHLETNFERFMKQDMDSHEMILIKLEKFETELREMGVLRRSNNHG